MTFGRKCAEGKPEETVTKLRQLDASPGQSLANAIRQIGVSEIRQHGR
jgi:hypothetical protein